MPETTAQRLAAAETRIACLEVQQKLLYNLIHQLADYAEDAQPLPAPPRRRLSVVRNA